MSDKHVHYHIHEERSIQREAAQFNYFKENYYDMRCSSKRKDCRSNPWFGLARLIVLEVYSISVYKYSYVTYLWSILKNTLNLLTRGISKENIQWKWFLIKLSVIQMNHFLFCTFLLTNHKGSYGINMER